MYDQIMAVTFDTLKASRQLQDAGFDEAKADALVSIFAGEIGASLSTKDDIATVRTDLTQEIAAVRTDLTQEISVVRVEMKHMEERLDQRIDAVRADVKHVEERLEQRVMHGEERLEQRVMESRQWLLIRVGAVVGGGVAVLLAAIGIVTGILLAAG